MLNKLKSIFSKSPQQVTIDRSYDWFPPLDKSESTVDVAIFIAFQDRHKVLSFVVSELAHGLRNKVLFNIVLACSKQEDVTLCQQLQSEHPEIGYAVCQNNPIGNKWQISVDCCRKLNPEFIAITGSDDYLSADFILRNIASLRAAENRDIAFVGLPNCYIIAIDKKQEIKMWEFSYLGSECEIPLGGGRVYTKKFLDRIDWQIFAHDLNKQLDNQGYYKAKEAGFEVLTSQMEGTDLLAIKGDWEMMNELGNFFQSTNGQFTKIDASIAPSAVVEFLKNKS